MPYDNRFEFFTREERLVQAKAELLLLAIDQHSEWVKWLQESDDDDVDDPFSAENTYHRYRMILTFYKLDCIHERSVPFFGSLLSRMFNDNWMPNVQTSADSVLEDLYERLFS